MEGEENWDGTVMLWKTESGTVREREVKNTKRGNYFPFPGNLHLVLISPWHSVSTIITDQVLLQARPALLVASDSTNTKPSLRGPTGESETGAGENIRLVSSLVNLQPAASLQVTAEPHHHAQQDLTCTAPEPAPSSCLSSLASLGRMRSWSCGCLGLSTSSEPALQPCLPRARAAFSALGAEDQ